MRDSSMREQAHRQGRPRLSPNIFQVADVEKFLSAKDAKDAKDAKKSEGTRQSDHRHGERTQPGMLLHSLRPWRPLRTKIVLHQQLEVCSVRVPVAPAGALIRASNWGWRSLRLGVKEQ